MGLTVWPPAATGDVDGPASSTTNAAAVWGNTTGTALLDGASVNILGKQFVGSFTTTATAAGTTTLTVSSNPIQAFTGVTTQTVVLPVVTTLPKTGFAFVVINDSTGALTVNSSGANLVQTMAAGSRAVFTCILLTGTTAASWAVTYTPVIAQTITEGVTTSAPSEDAVFVALTLKAPQSAATVLGNPANTASIDIGLSESDVVIVGDTYQNGNRTKVTVKDGDGKVTFSTNAANLVLLLPGLPTANPAVAGQVWNDSGTLKVSAG